MSNREPACQFDPPATRSDPPNDSDLLASSHDNGTSAPTANAPPDPRPARIEATCPWCGQRLSLFADHCPRCEASLPFGGTFTPGKSAVAKAVSWILLVIFLGSMTALVGFIVGQMMGVG